MLIARLNAQGTGTCWSGPLEFIGAQNPAALNQHPISVSLLIASAPPPPPRSLCKALTAGLLLHACLCIFFDCVKSLCVQSLPTQGELGEQGQGPLPQLDL